MTVNPELLRASAAHYADGELSIEAVALAEVADAVSPRTHRQRDSPMLELETFLVCENSE